MIPRYRGVYFGLYDTGAAKNPWKNDKGIAGMGSKFAIAQATAITAGYASYPFDTVRRRLQMQSEKPKSEWHYQGALDCLKKIMKEEGEFRPVFFFLLRTRCVRCRDAGVEFDPDKRVGGGLGLGTSIEYMASMRRWGQVLRRSLVRAASLAYPGVRRRRGGLGLEQASRLSSTTDSVSS